MTARRLVAPASRAVAASCLLLIWASTSSAQASNDDYRVLYRIFVPDGPGPHPARAAWEEVRGFPNGAE